MSIEKTTIQIKKDAPLCSAAPTVAWMDVFQGALTWEKGAPRE